MRIERPLTSQELAVIEAAPTWDGMIAEIFKAMIPNFNKLEKVDPMSVAVPKEQWQLLCSMITLKAQQQYEGKASRKDINLGIALEFMNKGPSSY